MSCWPGSQRLFWRLGSCMGKCLIAGFRLEVQVPEAVEVLGGFVQ